MGFVKLALVMYSKHIIINIIGLIFTSPLHTSTLIQMN